MSRDNLLAEDDSTLRGWPGLPDSLRRAATGPATAATFALLVVPFALGWYDAALFSPLALPGYLLFGIGTAIGNAVAPRFEFWLYWAPFLAGSYGVSVIVGYGYERWIARTDDRSSL
ncbi:hypothetical protein [Natronolimnohabitans innermongolicus]|uniref:Uncharacterized protein n=1 Tax=Natronolimnohabitans innermongolicus JCM 12255 TaxID=1227499 RepID=L9X9Y9_9EURY|nr:hypothetical protein [Natronolimnohabitans innermongolicus]ELY57443.1 hypothetical protein C493_08156 [Natronolimnohabitans innermongolicus JCM 12255]